MGRRRLTQIVADALVKNYGKTLTEHGWDVEMAEAVITDLEPFLEFDPEQDLSEKAYTFWKKQRDVDEEQLYMGRS